MQSSDLPLIKHTSDDFEQVLKRMLRGTAGKFGEEFFFSLVENLCHHLDVDGALIGQIKGQKAKKIQTLAVYRNDQQQSNFTYSLNKSCCEQTIAQGLFHCEQLNKLEDCDNHYLTAMNMSSYLGVSLIDSQNQKIGVLAIFSHHSLSQLKLLRSVLQLFVFRISAELERQSMIQSLRDEISVNQSLLDAAPALMFMIDAQGNFLRWNEYYFSKFGYTREDMQTGNLISAVHPSDQKRVILEIQNILQIGYGTLYLNGMTKQSDLVPLLATAQLSQYEGKPVIVGVALDMTEQQSVEHNLLRSQGRLARKNSQLSLINELVEKLHASHSVKHIASEVIKILKTVEDEALLVFSVVDQSSSQLNIVAASDMGKPSLQIRNTFPIGDPGSPTGIAILSKKLEIFADVKSDPRIAPKIKTIFLQESVKSCLVLPLVYQDEVLGGITIGFKYDSEFPADEINFFRTIGSSISLSLSNARQFERMESLATSDSLTGLPNRNALTTDSSKAIEQNAKDKDCLGLILIDLDRFKEINDTLDHRIGDKLLKLLGPRIHQALNDKDAQLYRLGGDEFCVLVRHKKNAKAITQVAELIKQAIEQVFIVDGLNLEISSSIGVLTTKGKRYDPNEMLRCVELAMYHAKNAGGGIAHYTPELDADTEQRFVIMSEMAEAIRNDDLVLHYQPKYDLKTQQITGCEALVRWQHKDYGLLPPIKFIPLIELTQLIHPLTFWVMKTAMSQLQKWKQAGIKINMAINLSTRNLTDENFLQQVDSLMEKYAIESNEIEFELTETALISNIDRATAQLDEFKKRHIQCSLDDYGTGYSSLSYIKKMPLDILKIDSAFITQMLDDSIDSIIAKSTIELAHNLGMRVVAEGVEDGQTLRQLSEQGCDMVQGYFICKPVTAEQFIELYWQYQDKNHSR